MTGGTDRGSKKAAQMRRLTVSRHQTRRTISLPSMDDAGPITLFHVGLGDPLEPLLEQLPTQLEYERWPDMDHAFDHEAIEANAGKVIAMSFGRLDDRALKLVKRVGKHRLPLIVLCDGDPNDRAILRDTARSVGASTLILRSELSARSLDQAIVHARDVSRIHFQHAQLSERYALAIRGAQDGLWEWELDGDRIFYSQRWCELLGLESHELTPGPAAWFDRVHPHDLPGLQARIAEHIAGMEPVLQYEHRVRCADGVFRWFLVRGVAQRREDESVTRIAGSFSDVTAFRAQAAVIRAATRQDVVTDLPRRPVLLERLARALEISRGYDDYQFGLLLIECSNLQQVTEGLGPNAADTLLSGMARRLRDLVDDDDLLTTVERGQFAVLLENLEDPGEGPQLAGRVHELMRAPFELDGESVFTSVNIGMTSSAQPYEQVDDVLADVASAVRRARSSSSRHEMHDTSIRIEARTLLRLEMAMHDAIRNEEFELFYQPIVDFARWHLHGFEALLRWRHPTRGLVSPGEFIPVAEDTGLIVPIGRWSIRQVCRQLSNWLENAEVSDDFTVSVNLSARQIADPQLLPTLRDALREWRIPPQRLKLELTESVLMNDSDEVADLFRSIRAEGVQLFIDDFGTGYSSLSYLHRFPVDGLKVDRAFVRHLDGSRESSTMVRTILALAENLGVDVIAEGIELDVQAEQLLELGCNKLQGFLFARPMPINAARALVDEGPSGAFRTIGGDHR